MGNCSADNTTAPLSYNSGWLIEGMSVWANVTQNSILTTQLQSLISSMANNPNWTDPAGVLNEIKVDSNPQVQTVELKSILVRGLTEAYNRNPSDNELIKYIGAFISVQYNAVLTNATSNQSNGYSASWLGPSMTSPPSGNSTTGNIMALDVLNAGFFFAQQGGHTSNSSRQNMSSPIQTLGPLNHEHGHSNRQILIGSIIGGATAIIILVSGLLFVRRKRAANKQTFSLNRLFPRRSTPTMGYFDPSLMTSRDPRNSPSLGFGSSLKRATATTTTSNSESTAVLDLHLFPPLSKAMDHQLEVDSGNSHAVIQADSIATDRLPVTHLLDEEDSHLHDNEIDNRLTSPIPGSDESGYIAYDSLPRVL